MSFITSITRSVSLQGLLHLLALAFLTEVRQAYVFQGMMVNEFSKRIFSCGRGCQCIYQTDLASQYKIRGTGVLEEYGYVEGRTGKWVAILIGIITVYRLFGWIALVLRKS